MAGVPVTNQPEWMASPGAILGCPTGLEYLTQLDKILVHQQVKLFQLLVGKKMKKKYDIKNSLGQQCYFAYEEEPDLCKRLFPGRGFLMHIVDNMGEEIIKVERESKFCDRCNFFSNTDGFAFTLSVESPTGTPIGYIRDTSSAWKPGYDVMNANRETVLKIKGPDCICSGVCCTSEISFEVFTVGGADPQPIAKISRQWSGFLKEAFTDANNFELEFPQDLDVKMKAVLLGTTFLIQKSFFEKKKTKNSLSPLDILEFGME